MTSELRPAMEVWHSAWDVWVKNGHPKAAAVIQAYGDEREAKGRAEQAREIERLRKLTCATWFYMPDESERCWFSPHEVIDQMYDPEPGNHVFEVECARSLPSIWCAVRVTDDPDADERFTFTEHATEAEARATLGDSHDQ